MGEILRFLFLGSHYRSPLNYSSRNLENAKLGLRRIYVTLQKSEQAGTAAGTEVEPAILDQFHSAMNDDFQYTGSHGNNF